MKTLAYCSHSFGRRLGRLARTSPILCPPTTDETFDLTLLKDCDFVWFKLHGRKGERYWYGDNWTTALSADRLARADLAGAVVFVSNCWLANNAGIPGPMLLALAQAGPKAIVGGAGTNYAGINIPKATDLLGLYFHFFLALGFSAWHALNFAKHRLRFKRRDLWTEDTLDFQVWRPTQIQGGVPT